MVADSCVGNQSWGRSGVSKAWRRSLKALDTPDLPKLWFPTQLVCCHLNVYYSMTVKTMKINLLAPYQIKEEFSMILFLITIDLIVRVIVDVIATHYDLIVLIVGHDCWRQLPYVSIVETDCFVTGLFGLLGVIVDVMFMIVDVICHTGCHGTGPSSGVAMAPARVQGPKHIVIATRGQQWLCT